MTTNPTPDSMLPSDRAYLEARRRAILIELGAIERVLGLARTRQPKHERERLAFERREGERYGRE